MNKLFRFIPYGTQSPWWMGLAYRDAMRDGCLYISWPFNWVYRLFRWVIFWAKYPRKMSWEEKINSAETYAETLRLENQSLRDTIGAAKGLAVEIRSDIIELVKDE